MLRIPLALLSLSVLLAPSRAGAEAPLRELAYAGGPLPTLDLYLPEGTHAKPPLVVFVSSRFWSRSDDARLVEWGFARPLLREGAAVAVVRHRLAPAQRHPAFSEDVAEALGFLARNADRFGYDAHHLYLAGHSSGGQLASLLALDPDALRRAGIDPAWVAGVVAISGLYDLDPAVPLEPELEGLVAEAFGDRSQRRAASPLRRARADAPAFLVLAAGSDVAGLRAQAAAFSEALRTAGAPLAETFVALGRDHLSILDLADDRNPARAQVLGFLGLGARPEELRELLAGRRTWRDPPFSTEPFFALGAPVQRFDADERFLRELNRPFVAQGGRPPPVRPKTYRAVDLFELLQALGPERTGGGDHLVLTDARGERSTWSLAAMKPYRPVVVIGLDDERNLFRITDVYHTRRMYSWAEPERRRVMAQPLGAFLYFLDEPPRELGSRFLGLYALVPESFRRVAGDPLARLRDLPPALFRLVVEEKACVSCHRLRGVGTNAVHLRLSDAERTGGVALDLEQYPPEVWRRYCFEQSRVADEVGATPVDLPPDLARLLYELVVQERSRLGL